MPFGHHRGAQMGSATELNCSHHLKTKRSLVYIKKWHLEYLLFYILSDPLQAIINSILNSLICFD